MRGRGLPACAVLLLACGCAAGKGSLYPVEPDHPKRCRADADCRLTYGVPYRGYCDSGCFNTGAQTTPECVEEAKDRRFPEGLGCVCDSGVCSLRRKE